MFQIGFGIAALRLARVLRPAGFGFLVLLSSYALAQSPPPAFDRAAAGERYRAWLARFEHDLRVYGDEMRKEGELDDPAIERIFADSIVPGSRAVRNVRDLYSGNRPAYSVGGEIVVANPPTLLLRLFRQSVPAGSGGIFPESHDSPFQARLSVWYMHIQGGDILEKNYFAGDNHFHPYHLPANGVLERDAYPFLMFDDSQENLRWGGVGREYWGAVETLWNAQLF